MSSWSVTARNEHETTESAEDSADFLLTLPDVGATAGELREQVSWKRESHDADDDDDDDEQNDLDDDAVKKLNLIDESDNKKKASTAQKCSSGQKRVQRQARARILSDLLVDGEASDIRMRRRADAVQATGSVHKMRRISEEVARNFELDLSRLVANVGVDDSKQQDTEAKSLFSTVKNRQMRYHQKKRRGRTVNRQPSVPSGEPFVLCKSDGFLNAASTSTQVSSSRALDEISDNATSDELQECGDGQVEIQRDMWGVPLLNGMAPPFHTLPAPFVCEMVDPLALYEHQKIGVTFAQTCELQQHRGTTGSLLCMEMGLGKSLTALMLTVLDKHNHRLTGPTLIVCPVSLINCWITDALHKFFHDRLKIMIFRKEYLQERWHTLTEETLRSFDIVLTNYETISNVAKECGRVGGSKAVTSNLQPTITNSLGLFDSDSDNVTGIRLLFHIQWHRIIADESQRFTNPNSICFKSMCRLQARNRLCLTGTPYRNYDKDLWAQFYFLGYRGTPHTKNWNRKRFEEHEMNRCIMLMSKEDAKIDLPPKRTRRYDLHLEGKELQIYLLFKAIIRLKASKSPSDALTILLLLRQLCLAPFLIAPEASSRLTGKPSAAEQRLNDCKHHAEYASFDPELRSKGQVSPVLVTLGKLCTRVEYLSALSRTVKNTAQWDGSTEVIAAELDAWLTDVNGTAGIFSAKMKAAIDLLRTQIGAGEKAIVFSSFEKAIRLLQKSLIYHGVSSDCVVVVTGKVDKAHRAVLFNRFRTHDACQFLLMTYGVGSIGLNLQEAQHVIHYEPWWNELNARQGTDRAHRIGQTKQVNEWYILIKDSIEEKIRERCIEKNEKSQAMLSGSRVSATASTTAASTTSAASMAAGNSLMQQPSPGFSFSMKFPDEDTPKKSEKEKNLEWLHKLMEED